MYLLGNSKIPLEAPVKEEPVKDEPPYLTRRDSDEMDTSSPSLSSSSSSYPHIGGIAELLRDYPDIDKVCAPRKLKRHKKASTVKEEPREGSSSSSSSSGDTDKYVKSLENNLKCVSAHPAEKIPSVAMQIWTDVIKGIDPNEFYMFSELQSNMTHEEITKVLRERRGPELTLMLAGLECDLLREAGVWEVETTTSEGRAKRTFPACLNGQLCVFAHLTDFVTALPTDKHNFVCTAMMFHHEYSDLILHDKQPSVARKCVGCTRFELMKAITQLRMRSMSGDSLDAATSEQWKKQNVPIKQTTYNKVGLGEYYPQAMFKPLVGEFALESFVCFTFDSFTLRTEPGTGRAYADQSKILWTAMPAPVPAVGEKMRHFPNGAKQTAASATCTTSLNSKVPPQTLLGSM